MREAPASTYGYLAYGYNLISDMPLAQLLPGTDPALDTVTLSRRDSLPEGPQDVKNIGPFVKAATNYLFMQISEVVDFVALDGTTLLYRPHDGVDLPSLQVFLLGSGLGALLMQRDLLVIHGNAIEIDGVCVLCVGPSGVGKSTTALALMQRGYRVISDDVCAINAKGQIIPGIPHIKLWQEAADNLKVQTAGLSRIRPELEKYRVPMGDSFCGDPIDVRRIYVLSPHNSGDIVCETLKGRDKFLALRGNTYRPRFVDGLGMRSAHFQQITTLSQQVTVKRLKRPSSGFQLDRLLDALIADALDHRAPA